MTQRIWPEKIVGMRKVLMRYFAIKATRGWRPARSEMLASMDTHVFLATSEQFAPVTLTKWKHACPGLRIVSLSGDHANVLALASRQKLIPAFEDAVLASCARQP